MEDLGQGLLQVLVRRSCGDPGETLSRVLACSGPCELWRRGPGEILYMSLHDLVQVLVRRSCGDLVEILLKRSLH